jgi:hypothetical protein
VAALVLAAPASATAADGGSGTYTARGPTVDFDLVNSGTASWVYFSLVAPPGLSFVGAATSGENTARCVVGEPDGGANEIECGPVSVNAIQPDAHLLLVGTLSSPGPCGAPFQLEVSTTGPASFTRVGDITFAGSCTADVPRATTAPTIRVVGRTLVARPATWSEPPTQLAYRWQRCTGSRCLPIAGATTLRLRLTRRDLGHGLRLVATAAVDGVRVTSASRRVTVRA